jgi:hypothetical protein
MDSYRLEYWLASFLLLYSSEPSTQLTIGAQSRIVKFKILGLKFGPVPSVRIVGPSLGAQAMLFPFLLSYLPRKVKIK